jgi:hypothetical protein
MTHVKNCECDACCVAQLDALLAADGGRDDGFLSALADALTEQGAAELAAMFRPMPTPAQGAATRFCGPQGAR